MHRVPCQPVIRHVVINIPTNNCWSRLVEITEFVHIGGELVLVVVGGVFYVG